MDINYNRYELTNNVNLRFQKREIKEEKPEPENVLVSREAAANSEKVMKSSEVMEFFNRAALDNLRGNSPQQPVTIRWDHYENEDINILRDDYLGAKQAILAQRIDNEDESDISKLIDYATYLMDKDPVHKEEYQKDLTMLNKFLNFINRGNNRSGNDGNTPVGDRGSEEPEPAKGNPFGENISENIVINRSGDEGSDYETVLNEAKNLNKEVWSDIANLMTKYGITQPEEQFSEIGDNPDPNDERFQVLSKLSDKLTDDERNNIKEKVFKLIDLLSQAHELNNFEYGEEDVLKHPLTYGIIENIINR